MRKLLLPLVLVAASPLLPAAQLEIEVEIPQLAVAEYHRPYVALWLEQNGQYVANLNVWYDIKMKDSEGEKWLKDMRQWWRRSGRTLEFPVDGVSAATRAPGVHTLSYSASDAALQNLQAGEFQLLVEAAREVGGRELLRIPLQWPISQQQTGEAHGSHELGRVTATLTP